eukprot:gb/GEZJ01005397.1/.p1 GENE.gb/GEZJ01005397.1/~~gb/GEZJ01005397.1/.p1  ORF type:complete len:101 (-),score=6.78 gb/GEZJ01005397.1/:597-899(-)
MILSFISHHDPSYVGVSNRDQKNLLESLLEVEHGEGCETFEFLHHDGDHDGNCTPFFSEETLDEEQMRVHVCLTSVCHLEIQKRYCFKSSLNCSGYKRQV